MLRQTWGIDAAVGRPTVVAKLEELRDRGWVARAGDCYELTSTAVEHFTAQVEPATEAAREEAEDDDRDPTDG